MHAYGYLSVTVELAATPPTLTVTFVTTAGEPQQTGQRPGRPFTAHDHLAPDGGIGGSLWRGGRVHAASSDMEGSLGLAIAWRRARLAARSAFASHTQGIAASAVIPKDHQNAVP